MDDAADWVVEAIKGPPWWAVGLGLGVAASAVALVGFSYWLAQLRRSPELRFQWTITRSDDPSALEGWPPDRQVKASAGAAVLVEVSVQNVGAAATHQARSNLVIPTALELLRTEDDTAKRPDPVIVGGTPYSYVFRPFDLPAGDWFLQRFRLLMPSDHQGSVRLMMIVSDNGLNASGKRWLPNRLVGGDPPITTAAEPWPPPQRGLLKQWTRVCALPTESVWCVRGVRADARDVHIERPPDTP